jgi:asparagine synthetase B (glutamine-hydrolysing)
MTPLEEYSDQFVLFGPEDRSPDTWVCRRLADWTLASHPMLPVVEVRTGDGSRAGWLLGHAVTPGGELQEGGVSLPCHRLRDVSEESFETFLYGFGGRFACVLCAAGLQRFYLDPFGSLAAVYATSCKIVGSTVTVVNAVRGTSVAEGAGIDDFFANRPNQFYPAGLSADPDVQRLLPNHYLDLSRWHAVRHWPQQQIERVRECQTKEHIEVIVAGLSRNVSAVTAARDTYMGLTAGRDSRMQLACVPRDRESRIEFVTFDYRDGTKQSRVDVHLSRRLARDFSLSHRVIPVGTVTDETRRQYLLRIGYAGGSGKARDFYQACREHLALDRAWLVGFGGEVGIGYYWRDVDRERRPVRAEELLERVHLPINDTFCCALSSWMAELTSFDSFLMLDLFYLENRVGCWAAPHLYGAAPFSLSMIPFCHRHVVEASYRLPIEYRQRKQLSYDVVNTARPALCRYPFQGFVGARRWYEGVRRRCVTFGSLFAQK